MEYIFWLSTGLVVYTYIIYPLILSPLSRFFGSNKVSDFKKLDKNDLPTVGIIIAAYNEESEIINRLENLDGINYPKEKYIIYLGSDGSTDNTNNLVENYKNENLKFYPFEERRGKASVLNDLCASSQEEILVFSDANTMFEASAVNALVVNFNKENTGGVCGELKLLSNDKSDNQDGAYWKYEKYIKRKEAEINGLLGANGAIYAIRRKLFVPIPSNTIVDDFMIAMNIVLQGYDLRYEPSAIANEFVPDTISQEFNRRVRIGVGNYQAFFRLPRMLNPFYKGTYFFTYFSHKVIRWFTPHLLLMLLISNLFLLVDGVWYQIALALQITIYIVSVIAVSQSLTEKFPSIFRLAIYFIVMNTAFMIGFIKYLKKNINPAWERTARE